MITIYHLGLSQSDRIVWLMEELGLPYELEVFVRHPSGYAPDGLRKIHPLGRAPVIRDGDLVLAESAAIVEYICQTHGGGRLLAKPGAPTYADFLFWFHFTPATLAPMALYKMFAARAGADGIDYIMRHFLDQLDIALALLDDTLSRQPYLAGDALTAADIMMMFPITTSARFNGLDLKPYGSIRAYIDRVGERPAYRRAMDIAGPDRGAGLPEVYDLEEPDGASVA